MEEVGAFLNASTASVKMRLHRARQHLRQEAFDMVERALDEHQSLPDFRDRVHIAELTVFFSDIANFGHMMAQHAPEEVVSFLYDYMSDMTQIILDADGTPVSG